jgi:diguanylate cyclase (GGDEF)-like protein
MCLMALALSAAQGPQGKARALQAEVMQLRGTQPKVALAKGEEALGLLASAPDERLELLLLQELARLQQQSGNLQAAKQYVARGEALAKRLGDKAAQRAFSAVRIAVITSEGNSAEGVRLAKELLKEAQAAKDDSRSMDALGVLGLSAGRMGNFLEGIQYLHQALELAERVDDPRRKQALLTNLSSFYSNTQAWNEALKTNLEAAALARQLEDAFREAALRVNAAIIYDHLDQQEECYRALMDAEALGKKANLPRVLMGVNVNLSDYLLHKKDYKGALVRAERGMEMAKQMNDHTFYSVARVNRGIALNRLGQHEAGLAELEAGLKAHRASEAAGDETELLGVLAEEYAFTGDFKKAYEYHLSFKEKNDKLYNDSRVKTMHELEARYQSEKQERQINQLQAEGERRTLVRNFSIVGALLGLALAAALMARYRLLRRSSDQLEALNAQLELLSVTDALTGLRNRRFFLQQVERDTSQADRAHNLMKREGLKEGNRDLIFFIVDLDHFKHVNDTYGHLAGDMVLKQAVERMRGAIRDSDDLVRWGGEEFLLTARQTRREDASILAERIRAAIEAAPFDLGEGRSLVRTCSIGYAAYPFLMGHPGRPKWETVVDLADQALYVAKTSGRNGWVGVFGSEDVPIETIESGLAGGLRGLVAEAASAVQCSFPDPGALNWGGKG